MLDEAPWYHRRLPENADMDIQYKPSADKSSERRPPFRKEFRSAYVPSVVDTDEEFKRSSSVGRLDSSAGSKQYHSIHHFSFSYSEKTFHSSIVDGSQSKLLSQYSAPNSLIQPA